MGIYGYGYFQENVGIESEGVTEQSSCILTEEEVVDIINTAIVSEALESSFNIVEPLQEGANSDMWDVFKNGVDKYKAALRASKKYYKSGDNKKALEEAKKASKALKDMEAGIKKIDSDITSTILGYFLGSLLASVQLTVTIMIPVVGLVATSVSALVIIIKNIKQLIDDLEEGRDLSTSLNYFRSRLLAYTKIMNRSLNDYMKKLA